MLELLVAHHAGMPLLMTPRSGNRRDAQEFGRLLRAHIEQVHPLSGASSVVADSALSSAEHLQQLAETPMKWIPRVPATWHAAQAVLSHAAPQAMAPRQAGSRSQASTSPSAGVAPRWGRIDSAPRQPQAQRTVDTPCRTQRDQEGQALQQLCRPPCACEAEARQALATFEQAWQTTCFATSTAHVQPRYGKRGRPQQGGPPAQVVSHLDGALASSLVARHARLDPHRCFILATHARDAAPLPPPELLAGDTGQVQAERGCRCVQAPQFLAAALSLKKPERLMVLLMVMTVCLLV